MKPYLNVWRAVELTEWDLQTIKDCGFKGLRFDVQVPYDVVPSCQLLAAHGLEGLMLINGGKMPLSHEDTIELVTQCADQAQGAVSFEIGNEPDIAPGWEDDHDGFGRMVNAAAMVVAGRFPVVSGGLYGTTMHGLTYLREALQWMDPSIIMGIHSYRQTGGPSKPSKWFANRTQEFDAIQDVAGLRKIWCTEMGWHTAPFDVGWRRKQQWKDDEVLAFLAEELQIEQRAAYGVSTVYQYTDGPSEEGIDNFGIKYFDVQELKPQALCVLQSGL